MADDWEDWENESYVPPVPAAPVAGGAKPGGFTSLTEGVDMSKFADEEQAELEEKKHLVPTSQPKKKEEKKYLKEEVEVDTPLDDPVAEKLRQQRLQEESDINSFRELVGNVGNQLNVDTFLPKSLKDFEELASALATRYVVVHKDNKNFKAYIKALFKAACAPLPSTEIKDIETSLAGLRSDKHKAEQAEAAAKKGTKKQLNVGKSAAAGLDDYMFEDDAGDDYDFM